MSGHNLDVKKSYKLKADAAISQANPVSTTLYTVLDTTEYARILAIACSITWGVTQPTPLTVIVTVDGIQNIYEVNNPVSATNYYPWMSGSTAMSDGFLDTTDYSAQYRGWLNEGKSVKVQIRVTWAVTQPTPLVCRVKYEKLE